MGEVYEAEDLVLKERVALKTLLPQIATDEHFRARFRREVLLARKVTHPNVCRIFDVFGDMPNPESAIANPVSLPFMTMELLQGGTLAQFLESVDSTGVPCKKRLTADEALPLIAQMSAALEAAHKAGVVHRDFKSSNVFLAEGAANSPDSKRVVVTDFGLARMTANEAGADHSFTTANEFIGTPIYMAPEQVDGGNITAATDIYALGVVIYEMLTGRWPFLGNTARETAHLRLKVSPPAPKSFNPEIDQKWNDTILRCLERDPGDRFHSTAELIESLEGSTTALRRRTRAQRDRLNGLLRAGVAILVVIAALLAGFRWWPREAPAGTEPSVAVIRFRSLSPAPDKQWIGNSLRTILSRELAANESLRVVSPDDVARMQQELVVSNATELDQPKLTRIQQNLAADELILGNYELSGQPNDEQIRVTLSVSNPSMPKQVISIVRVGNESDLFGLTDTLARAIRTALKVPDITSADRTRLRAELPLDGTAARSYFDGLESAARFDPLQARDFLQDAVKRDPSAPLPHLALSQVWTTLGYDREAITEAKLAQESADHLAAAEQREIECRVLELQRNDWDSAIGACRAVWELRKRLQDGLRLVDVQFSAQRLNASISTLALLRTELPARDANDARIDNSEAQTREALTQYPEMKLAAQRALDKAKSRDARVAQAQALLWMCMAEQNLDQLDAAQEHCGTANDLFSALGDKIHQARALTALANALSKVNDNNPSTSNKILANYQKALDLATTVGSVRDRCDAILNLGSLFQDQKDVKKAELNYKESLELAERYGNESCRGRASENLGLIAKDRQQFSDAEKYFETARQVYENLNMGFDIARVQNNFGDLLLRKGEPTEARARLEDSVKRYGTGSAQDGRAFALVSLAEALLAQDEAAGALRSYREAQQIKNDLKQKSEAAVLDTYIAEVFLETNQSADAESLAKKMIAWCSQKDGKDPNNEVFARDVLVRSLMQQRRINDLSPEVSALEHSLKSADDEEVVLNARVTLGRAFAEEHLTGRAHQELEQVLRDARSKSYIQVALNAELASLEALRIEHPFTSPERLSLRKLQDDAFKKGYFLVARKAKTLFN
jgi:eukaryotic-like serine/threonine-protein kinase